MQLIMSRSARGARESHLNSMHERKINVFARTRGRLIMQPSNFNNGPISHRLAYAYAISQRDERADPEDLSVGTHRRIRDACKSSC